MAKTSRYYIDFIDNFGKTSRVYFFPKKTFLTPLSEMVGNEFESVGRFLSYLDNNDVKIVNARSVYLPMLAKHLMTVCNHFKSKGKVHVRSGSLTRKMPIPDLYTFFEILLQPLRYNGVELEGGLVQFAEAYLKRYTGFVYNHNEVVINAIPSLFYDYRLEVVSKVIYDVMDSKEKEAFDLERKESHRVGDSRYYYYYVFKTIV